MYELDKLSLEGFLEYSKEANTRSTLAVEDGLKPVHRRILYAMAEGKVFSNKSHVKSAKLVGDILGNYHPHGDSSVYDAAIRLSQDFKLRYPLIDFYGNNGSGASNSGGVINIPLRNVDGMTLDSTVASKDELYVIVRYNGSPTPLTSLKIEKFA